MTDDLPLPLADALPLLACPDCGASLAARAGSVVCEGCGRKFLVREGVLDFLSPPSHEEP